MWYEIERPTWSCIQEAVDVVVERLDFERGDLVVSGTSGMIVGLPVAQRLDRNLYIVRKGKNDSHGSAVEQIISNKRARRSPCTKNKSPNDSAAVWIVDDFVSSGATVRRMAKAMEKRGIKVRGALMYQRGSCMKKVVERFDDGEPIKVEGIAL